MSVTFEELAYSETPLGEICLRRRKDLSLGRDVYEIKLNQEFLMSSLFVVAEQELAHLGLSGLDLDDMAVVVGGLGLGYTAQAALENKKIQSLWVVEALAEVISWHQRHLLPLGAALTADKRCHFINGDFFALAQGGGFDPGQPGRRFHAILLDIDHAPDHTLHPSHAWLYTHPGLVRLAEHLYPGGVFALWSNNPPSNDFMAVLSSVFTGAAAHIVSFHNHMQNQQAANTIYVARSPR